MGVCCQTFSNSLINCHENKAATAVQQPPTLKAQTVPASPPDIKNTILHIIAERICGSEIPALLQSHDLSNVKIILKRVLDWRAQDNTKKAVRYPKSSSPAKSTVVTISRASNCVVTKNVAIIAVGKYTCEHIQIQTKEVVGISVRTQLLSWPSTSTSSMLISMDELGASKNLCSTLITRKVT